MSEGWEGFLNCTNNLSTGFPLPHPPKKSTEAKGNTELNINMVTTL